ncbi:hypothetical protein TWF506_008938 [Arthrobotrys conoides]|uniref:Uncharacterized protein n=1 Tax=Arthrobotrys conoides TaxID=74498 RepID=A0AAN8RTA0_9PEZI
MIVSSVHLSKGSKTDNMAKNNDFPDVIYNAFATSTDRLPTIPYKSFHDYLATNLKNFSDIDPIEANARWDPHYPPTTELYTLDIGQYSTHVQDNSYSLHGHAPIRGATNIDSHIRAAAPGTKLRMLFFFYQKMEKDPALLKVLASFYDLNPRILQEHNLRSIFHDSLDVSRLSVHDTCPNFLPSEALFSPIQLERAVRPRQKKMTITLVSGPSQDFQTILVLVSQLGNFYSRNIINRDILYPSQYTSPENLKSWRQPKNEAETAFLRLTRLNSLELEACVSQPIISVLPMVRSHCLETSQDVYQIREHVNHFGLGEAGIDTRFRTNHHPGGHWGSEKTDPFEAFQRINTGFTTSSRSLNDHLSFPWMDSRKPHMEYATHVVDTTLKDVKRVMEEVSDLRELLKESSSLILAKESIVEARRSAAQAESVTQLTRMAFIFIPLTFATSVFGMNIEEWQDDVPKLKWFFVTAISCTALTIVSAILLGRLSSQFRAWVKEHRGFWPGVGHFIRDWFVCILLTLVITIPNRTKDFVSGRMEDYRNRREEKRMKKKAAATMV